MAAYSIATATTQVSHPWPTYLWKRLRRLAIGSAVVIHFILGTLCFLQPPCALFEIPLLASMVSAYQSLDLGQTWRMFAPPSQTIDEIGFSAQLPDGWTKLLPMERFLTEEGAGRFILPRGYLRVANYFRHPIFQKKKLADEPFYFQYFQAMAAFYCFGDGAIPHMRKIRFYSITRGVPPFFATGADGHPFPKASDFDRTEALYERSCEVN